MAQIVINNGDTYLSVRNAINANFAEIYAVIAELAAVNTELAAFLSGGIA